MQQRNFYCRSVLLSLFLFCAAQLFATVTLPKVLGDNMVLQRSKPVAIWGTANKGEVITVSFAKQKKQTTADDKGQWKLFLDAMQASVVPQTMVIKGSNTITLNNILVGEVWLCSGQSNMEYTMMKESKFAVAKHGSGLDSIALKKERNPLIRLFLVKRDLTKPDNNINKGWNSAEGEWVRGFSAAGYFFAKKLYEELKVPIGMIASSIPGSAIEPWLKATPEADSMTGNILKWDETKPGKFYTGMIAPLAPYTLKGFLWYQGETNCFLKETTAYTIKFRNLIESWRELWNDKQASFYFVQIAPFYYSKSESQVGLTEETLPAFREAQAAALDVPHTGMIITTDLADNLNDIHPTYKWEVGRRLALLALAHDYGKKIEYAGPQFAKQTIKGGTIELEFTHTGTGLISNDGQPLTNFLIAGADGIFVPANAVINHQKVVVSAPTITAPRYVRFAWNEAAQPNLFNKEGLPAAPFRTDVNGQTATAKK